MSEERFWLTWWFIIGAALVGAVWAVAWGVVSYHRAHLDAGMVPMQVPSQYRTEWVKDPAVEKR